jgi:hypothetical protein
VTTATASRAGRKKVERKDLSFMGDEFDCKNLAVF